MIGQKGNSPIQRSTADCREAPSTSSCHIEQASSFGAFVYAARRRLGITQAVLANDARLSTGYLSQIENSKRRPPLPDKVESLAHALALDADQTASLQQLAIRERGAFVQECELPASVRNVIAELKWRALLLPPAFLRGLRKQIREAAM